MGTGKGTLRLMERVFDPIRIHELEADIVAWAWKNKWGGGVFGTSPMRPPGRPVGQPMARITEKRHGDRGMRPRRNPRRRREPPRIAGCWRCRGRFAGRRGERHRASLVAE